MPTFLRRFIYLLFVFAGSLPAASLCLAGGVGIYGVKDNSPELSGYNIDAVFLPPREELILEHAGAGRDVYLSLNVFGGTGAWKQFPDAVPVKHDGSLLQGKYGGVCPSHPGWRTARLQALSDLVRSFGGNPGISGIWLDFIRYPGSWEHPHPDIPDTCYCERCLSQFQADSGLVIPEELASTENKSAWIKSNAPLQWMSWKKEQITSFVRDARKILDDNPGGRKLQLGLFLVPWRKSDFSGAVSFRLAQDIEALSPYADVFSPMVYHRMVGEPAEWVQEITDYLVRSTGTPVWPIIQSQEVEPAEFGEVVRLVDDSAAEGLLVYTMRHMSAGQWPHLKGFGPPENLLLSMQDMEVHLSAESGETSRPQTSLPACDAGGKYLFSADFFRPDRHNSLAYPEVRIWGQDYLLNTHRMFDRYQRLKAMVSCPEAGTKPGSQFQVKSSFPGTRFSMKNPRLDTAPETKQSPAPVPLNSFFPIGTYGANAANLAEIREIGLNSGVLAMSAENIEKCLELGMRCTLSVPREPEKLILALERFESLLSRGNFIFYVNDEPGIHSFPEGKAEDIQRIIKAKFPEAMTNMAIVRPQVTGFYEKGADYFMLDQYPVPAMPMSWLADSMDEAVAHVGSNRLQSVIQAFGGEKYSSAGWTRLPTFTEMSNLAFLSIIHGSRGIYFYTFPAITATPQGREDFSRLVRNLNSMRSWLVLENDTAPVAVRMQFRYGLDPAGKPGVHCATKQQHGTRMLLCANTLKNLTVAGVTPGEGRKSQWRDYFGERSYRTDDAGQLLLDFQPLEVKVLMEGGR